MIPTGMARTMPRGSVCLTVALVWLAAASAHGQDVSAQDQRAAAEAYDRGTAAYIAREYDRAAHWFETAHRLAPAAAALVQAVRSHERGDNDLRAATLALRLEALYPDDRAARRTARRALRGSERWLRVAIECEACSVQLDGALLEHPEVFVEPDAEHRVVASFETGDRSETFQGPAGETRTLTFEAPPPPEPEPVADLAPGATDDPASDPTDAAPAAGGGGGVPVWVTITGLVVTAGLGGVLIWSGVDTLDGVPAYEANPTEAGLADGRSREERTNWLIGGTALAGATTLVLMIFTDWSGGGGAEPADDEVQVLFDIQGDGVRAGLTGRF